MQAKCASPVHLYADVVHAASITASCKDVAHEAKEQGFADQGQSACTVSCTMPGACADKGNCSASLAYCCLCACSINEYKMQRQAREDAEAARKAHKQEVADRMYERVKEAQEAAQAQRDEEDRLINLLRAEEEAERARRSAPCTTMSQVKANTCMQRLW